MIDPSDEDIGRGVVYTPSHGESESGVITSFNEYYVFVRYGSNRHSQATNPKQLEYES